MNKLKNILPEYIVNAINNLSSSEFNNLTEIRLRVNKPVYLIISNIEYGVKEDAVSKYDGIVFTKDDAKILWRKLCQGAPYSFVQQQREGYMTIDGNRVGFCGSYAVNEDNIKHIEQISSFCVRIKHQVKGCANKVFRYLFENNDFENTLFLIDAADALALVVLQFNTNRLLKLDPNTLVSDVIKEYEIDFDVSFSTRQVSKAEVKEILDNEKSTKISDITDGFDILREKIPHMELCNGSALIVDMDLGVVAYTITSAGKFFPKVFETVEWNPLD